MSRVSFWRDYYELTKPRVVLLMLITAWVGMALSVPSWIPWPAFVYGTLGIACCAGSAAVINHLVEQVLDRKMRRTHQRPVASGRVQPKQALLFAGFLGIVGFIILYGGTNPLTAGLTLMSQLTYALFYTLFLKHTTPQNIVIGGAAGAMPPLLGWTAVTGQIDPQPLLLVLIIFVWTPPHFWALAIDRRQDYEKAQLPMLPVTHGVRFTQINVLLYTLLMIGATWLPFAVGMSGWAYFIGVNVLNVLFFVEVVRLYRTGTNRQAMKVFWHSIFYLFGLFSLLLGDHYVG